MNLSKYFTLEEATFSDTAIRLGISNTPDEQQLANMRKAAIKLDILREYLGSAIIISSWLRVPELNNAIPGSSNTSHHTTGFAIDCRSSRLPVLDLCKVSKMVYNITGFDQIIHEYGNWMHISFHPMNRKQTLTIFRNDKGLKYVSGLLTLKEYLDGHN